jgi:hypothetical protein
MSTTESHLEADLVAKLPNLKYEHDPDIPPAEAEERYYAMLDQPDMAA